MKRVISLVVISLWCFSAFALTESEGIIYINNYYNLLNQYAVSENITLAKKIENMHIGGGYVYPDVEINLGKLPETKGVGIKSAYLASIDSRRNQLLKFIPKNIALKGNSDGICTMVYALYVYNGNEQPGKEILKYSVPLKMEIQNNDKKIRSIMKNNTSTMPLISLSKTSIFANAEGKTEYITVSSNVAWDVQYASGNMYSVTRNGNTLEVTIKPNTLSESRSDYFNVKTLNSNEVIKVSLSQSAQNNLNPSVQISNVLVLHDQDLDEGKGMIIKVSFNIQNMKGKEGRVSAYFYDNDGNALIDTNGRYHTSGNPSNISTGKNITPGYDNSKYTDLELKIPYSELHQTGTYSRTLKFRIIVWNLSVSPSKDIYNGSSYTTFTYTPNAETYLTVNGSTSNKIKSFSEYGGRETYTINTNASSFETWGVPSWCRIENKTSTSFTLVCEPMSTTGERSDYLKIKAGGKEIRIDIKQNGKKSEATIEKCWITHNLSKSVWNGYMWVNITYMSLHCHFYVSGHIGEDIRVCAFFNYANGNKVLTSISEFKSPDGQATVQVKGNCSYENTEWKDFPLNIPYSVFPKGDFTAQIEIHDKNGRTLAKSSLMSFSVY